VARKKKTVYVEVVEDEAVIHQRETVWYARIRRPGDGGYFRASTGTKNQKEAVQWCRAKHAEIVSAPRPEPGRTLGHYLDRVVERARRDRAIGTLSQSWLETQTAKAGILAQYWRDSAPGAVTAESWKDYLLHRSRTGRPRTKTDTALSRITLRHERGVLTDALKLALADGLIGFIPQMVLPTEAIRVRPYFTLAELDRFEAFLTDWIDRDPRRHVRDARQRLRFYVMMLRHTGLRTNDTLVLRWHDITVDPLDDGSETLVIQARGKGKDRNTISDRAAVPVYRALLAHSQETGRYAPSGLVFPSGSGDPKRFDTILRKALEAAGLRYASDGRVRSAYSIRHAYAMIRLSQPNARRDHLALNMGCSERILKEHYGSHADPLALKNELAG
jgi:integrase